MNCTAATINSYMISTLEAVKACKNTRAFELLGFTEACSANVAEVSINPDVKPNNFLNGIGYVINFSPSEYPEFNALPVIPITFIPWLIANGNNTIAYIR